MHHHQTMLFQYPFLSSWTFLQYYFCDNFLTGTNTFSLILEEVLLGNVCKGGGSVYLHLMMIRPNPSKYGSALEYQHAMRRPKCVGTPPNPFISPGWPWY